jgi:hypothetical protein
MVKFMAAFLIYGSGIAIALEFAAIIGATLVWHGSAVDHHLCHYRPGHQRHRRLSASVC